MELKTFQSAFIAVVCLTLMLRFKILEAFVSIRFHRGRLPHYMEPIAGELKKFQSAFIAVVCLTV